MSQRVRLCIIILYYFEERLNWNIMMTRYYLGFIIADYHEAIRLCWWFSMIAASAGMLYLHDRVSIIYEDEAWLPQVSKSTGQEIVYMPLSPTMCFI